jgi:hypothetical protein
MAPIGPERYGSWPANCPSTDVRTVMESADEQPVKALTPTVTLTLLRGLV